MENTLFPIRMELHIVFALIALLVFGLQFIRLRKKYHLVLAIAIPCSLIPYLVDDMMVFYIVGICEAAALLIALILAKTVDREKKTAEEAADASDASEESAQADTASEAQPQEADTAEEAPVQEETE